MSDLLSGIHTIGGVVGGWRPIDAGPAPKRAAGAPRRCSAPRCQTVLSRYNPAQTCTLHGGWRKNRGDQAEA